MLRKRRLVSKIYRRLFPKVYAFVAYRVGTVQDTEDIVSEIFFRVVRGIPKVDVRDQASLDAWVFKICRNTVIDYYRSNGRLGAEIEFQEAINSFVNDTSLEESLVRKERFLALRKLILHLPPREQEVILLRFLAEFRNWQIAEMLGIRERSVSAYISRGLRRLARLAEGNDLIESKKESLLDYKEGICDG
jgi:RNA polymerase sigma-70 factor (ECF subfamily)